MAFNNLFDELNRKIEVRPYNNGRISGMGGFGGFGGYGSNFGLNINARNSRKNGYFGGTSNNYGYYSNNRSVGMNGTGGPGYGGAMPNGTGGPGITGGPGYGGMMPNGTGGPGITGGPGAMNGNVNINLNGGYNGSVNGGYNGNMNGGYNGNMNGGCNGFNNGGFNYPNRGQFVDKKLDYMSGMSLSEKLAVLERMRKKASLGFALLIFFVAFLIISMLVAGSTHSALFSIVPFVIMFLIGFVLVQATKEGGFGSNDKFKALYKNVFVEDVLGKKYDNLFYSWKAGFPADAVRSFNLVRMGNRFHSEDYICATYKGVKFETSDVTVQQHTSSGKSSHTTTYFKGRMFVFYMPKVIQASIRVTPDAFLYRPTIDHRKDKLDMENINFNKQYNVYASDPHYAFYVITPKMMERILYLKGKYGYIILNFEGDRLFAAIPTVKDTFDADITHAIDYPTDRARAEAEAAVIADIMEVLEAVPRG